jgi:hypothetical protein
MARMKISTAALRADLIRHGFDGPAIEAILTQVQVTGEYNSITFRITADEDEQQFYVESFSRDYQQPNSQVTQWGPQK